MCYCTKLSSTFSVKNFSKDNDTLQNAADALVDYVKVGGLWAISNALFLWSKFGWAGAFTSILFNLLIMIWIWKSYVAAFKISVAKNPDELAMPKMNFWRDIHFFTL